MKKFVENHGELTVCTTGSAYEAARLDALITVLRDTGYTIHARDFRHWRATVRTTGYLIGLEPLGELTLYATNGVLGLFRRHSTGTVDTYHTHRPTNRVDKPQEKLFTGAITPLVQHPSPPQDTDADGNPCARPVRTRTRAPSKRECIMAELLGVTVEYLRTLK